MDEGGQDESIQIQATGSVGVIAIIKKAFRVLKSRPCFFFSITLTNLHIPLAAAVLLLNYFELWSEKQGNYLSICLPALILLFSVLSIATTVYSVACIYTSSPLSGLRLLKALPKFVLRLLVVMFISFASVLFLVGALLGSLTAFFYGFRYTSLFTKFYLDIAWLLLYLCFLMLLFHVSCVSILATIVCILEAQTVGDSLYCFKKASALLRSRILLVYSLYSLYLFFATIVGLFTPGFEIRAIAVGFSVFFTPGFQIGAIVGFSVVLAFVNLMGMIVFTLIYFMCKAYHRQQDDILAISCRLRADFGEYVDLQR